MKLFWFLSNFDLVFSKDTLAHSSNVLQVPQPNKENNNQLISVDSVQVSGTSKNAYQRSWFWKLSQKLDRPDLKKGPNHIFPKSMLKELARQGVDISHLEYSRPPGGHQRSNERGINTGIRKWEETMVHPDTGKDVIVIPFTFQEDFPKKWIIRGFLKTMNSGRVSITNLSIVVLISSIKYTIYCI